MSWRELTRSASTTALWWVFGISITVLLISLWGRAIVSDREVVTGAAQELAQADVVTEQVLSWVVGGLRLAPQQTQAAVDQLAELPEIQAVLSSIVDQVVEAAYSPGASTVDIGALLVPLAPRISDELEAYGVTLQPPAIESALGQVPPLALQRQPQPQVFAERVERPLTTATLVAVLLMVTASAFLLALSSDRAATLRGLALRVMVAGLSFWVILHLASWIADPGGGASPLRSTLSLLFASRGEVPLLVAAVGVAIVGGVVLSTRRRRAGTTRSE